MIDMPLNQTKSNQVIVSISYDDNYYTTVDL